MADKTINELTAATTMGNDDLLVLQQGGAAKKLSGKQLGDYIYNAAAEKVAEVNQAVDDARSSINDIVESVQSMTELGTDTTLTTTGMAADAKAAGDKIKAVETAAMADLSQGAASGSIVTITDGADNIPVKKITVDIEPVQEGTGDSSPDNIRPISGWTGAKVSRTGKNLFGGNKLIDDANQQLSISITKQSETSMTISTYGQTTIGRLYEIKCKPNTRYTFIARPSNNYTGALPLVFLYSDGTNQWCNNLSDGVSITVSKANKTVVAIGMRQSATVTYLDQSKTGLFEGDLTADNFEPYQGETYDITFPSEAGTVGSGSIDINEDGAGTLTVSRQYFKFTGDAIFDSGSDNTYYIRLNSNMAFPSAVQRTLRYCNLYTPANYQNQPSNLLIETYRGTSPNKTNGYILRWRDDNLATLDDAKAYLNEHNLEIVIDIPTPQTYTLTADQVTTLLGTNNVWSDTGDITEFIYRKAPIDSSDVDAKIAEADEVTRAAIESMIAGRETAMKATKNYTSGGLVIVNHTIYKLDANVASGETFAPGINCHMTTVEAEIAERVPISRFVNGIALSSDVILTSEDIPYDDSLSDHTSGSVGEVVSGLKESITQNVNKIVESIGYVENNVIIFPWRMAYVDDKGIEHTSTNTALSPLLDTGNLAHFTVDVGYKAKFVEFNSVAQSSASYVGMSQYYEGDFSLSFNAEHYYLIQLARTDAAKFNLNDLPDSVVASKECIPSQDLFNVSEKCIYYSDSSFISRYYIDINNRWVYTNQPKASAFFNISRGYYKIKANGSYNTYYALLDKTLYNDFTNLPAFITKYKTRIMIPAGEDSTIYADKDCVLYLYNMTQAGDVYFPESIVAYLSTDIEFKKIGRPADAYYVGNIINPVVESYNEVFNLYSEDKVIRGISINSSGEVVSESSYMTTDYIEIPKKYGKNLLYTHLMVNGSYSGTAAFYDANKQFIETISVTAYITNADNYAYLRYTIPTNSTKIEIEIKNETIMPQYKKQELNFDELHNWFDYEKNIVSDGCMTAMIRTALGYLNLTVYGYGTEHTAFAESCVKSTKDTHTTSSTYDGERYQIDCSTFVLLTMLGIKPECSRYFYTKNVPSEYGYKFNGLVEYEGYVYGVAQTANTKRLYANSIAEYAYKNGFLYVIEKDFSNVKQGDILFTSNQGYTYGFFKDIGHCSFVYNVIPLEAGGNAVEVFEATGSNAPAHLSTLTDKQAAMIYGARFPLNYVKDVSENIATFTSQIQQTVSGVSGTTFDIATISLTKPLFAGNVYTAIISSELKDDGYFKLSIGGSTYVGYSNGNVLKRPDGKVVIRFVLYSNLTLTNPDTIGIKFVSTDAIDTTITVSDFKLYDGYVTT